MPPSAKFTPASDTRMRISPAAGDGASISFTRMPSNGPNALTTAARMGVAALLLTEYVYRDPPRIHRARPARVERNVGDQALQLGFRHAVLQCALHVAAHLVGAVERGEDRYRRQAAVALAQILVLPDVAEQHVVAQLPQLRNEFIHRRLPGHGRSPFEWSSGAPLEPDFEDALWCRTKLTPRNRWP